MRQGSNARYFIAVARRLLGLGCSVRRKFGARKSDFFALPLGPG
jgi:hypothetical protein